MTQLLSTSRETNTKVPTTWKTQAYGIGIGAGLVLGLMAAFMYARAAEDDASRTGRATRIQTGDLLGLGLALLAVMRQVAELGRAPDEYQKKRR